MKRSELAAELLKTPAMPDPVIRIERDGIVTDLQEVRVYEFSDRVEITLVGIDVGTS